MYFIWIYNNVQTRYFKCDFLKNFYGFWQITALNFWPILHFNSYASPSFHPHADCDASSRLDTFTILWIGKKNKFLDKFSRIFLWSHLGHIALVIFGSSAKPVSGKLIQAIYQMWISFPGIVLAHDRKIKISKKMDEFSRNRLIHYQKNYHEVKFWKNIWIRFPEFSNEG